MEMSRNPSKSKSPFKTSVEDPDSHIPSPEDAGFPASSDTSTANTVSEQPWESNDLLSTVGEVVHLDPELPLPGTLKSEQTSIAYIHFSSIGYCQSPHLILEQY